MAFNDPIQYFGVTYDSTTVPTLLGGGVQNFARIADGEYSSQEATTDEPRKIIIKNSAPTSMIRPTRFALQHWHFKNAPTAAYAPGAFPEDDFCVVEVSVRYVPRSFDAADIQKGINNASLLTIANTSKLMRGEK